MTKENKWEEGAIRVNPVTVCAMLFIYGIMLAFTGMMVNDMMEFHMDDLTGEIKDINSNVEYYCK